MKQRKIVGYCRVSTLEQKKKGYGIDIQMHDIERYARERGWQIAGWYKDEPVSGVEERRKALQRLLRDCRAGTIEAIIMANLDRFSRSLRLSENFFYAFEQMGVPVHIVDMPHYDARDRKEVLMRQIKAAIAEENRKEIIERLRKGREERARKGNVSGGNLSYGYMRVNGKAQVDPKEAQIVRKMYALSDQGLFEQEIADTINSEGHRQRNGEPWTQRQVWKILHRRALYREGIVKYGEVVGKNPSLVILS
ncbi:MAG: recombinase family protein [bacterium]|nr:recombinase family protein [bacterium]